MAANPADDLTHFMRIGTEQADLLGRIRHWSNLKIAFDGNDIWVRDLSAEQLQSTDIRSIPSKKLYYQSGRNLFPEGSLLPETTVPTVLWTPIERGLPLQLPARTPIAAVTETIRIQLVPSEEEYEAFALLTDVTALEKYMHSAPAIRLQNLQWTLAGAHKALITGTPLLPLPGNVYWRRNNQLLPAGYDLEWQVLGDVINRRLDPDNDSWIVWDEPGSWFRVAKKDIKPLRTGSFRLSIETMKNPGL
ncbi:MAG: hypothetical protein IBJ09_11350 [Bacteroidia bacterium]|nr:hypothetical protein [Bacteroidia bacterium]